MPIDQTPLTDALAGLRAQMAQAAATGRTADDERKLKLASRLGKAVIDLMSDYADKGDGAGGLDTPEFVHTLAGVIGCLIRVYATDPSRRLTIALDCGTIIVSLALKAEGEDR